jgi:membrane protease YdiL (CAAX protease family)
VVPAAAAKVREPHPTLPLAVAFGALVSLAVPLVASRFILRWLAEYRWPIAVYVVLVAVIGYGPPLLFWRHASRRWGSGALRSDVGLTARWADAGWGPVTWLACFGTQMIVGVIVVQTHIPIQSNTEGIRQARHNTGYVVPLLITAVIAAPIVEEIIFRGLVQRGLLSVMRPWMAVGTQAVLFGAAHFDPSRGMGNIGLVILLSSVGAVLGGSSYLLRRLAPNMIAHALLNTLAMVIVLSGWTAG